MPISVRSPSLQTAEDERRKHFGPKRDEDSLFASAELAARVLLSVLRNYDLKRADAMPVEEVLALSL